jgi:hypothetical protein
LPDLGTVDGTLMKYTHNKDKTRKQVPTSVI